MKREAPNSDQDELAKCLERAWAALEAGDPTAATRAADEAVRLAPEDPEALTARGVARTANGDDEAALVDFRLALEIDPEFAAPALYAAEILVDPERDPEEALRLAETALEVAEAEEDFIDAVLIRAQALLHLGRNDEARSALAELPPVELPDAEHHLRAAWLLLDLGVLDDTEHHLRHALSLNPESADAYHAIGLVAEARDHYEAQIKAWLRTRELDLAEPAPPWSVSPAQFEAIAEEALAELPERARALLANVPIVAEDVPSVDVVAEGYDPRLLGLFSGVPYPEKSSVTGAIPHLDAIHLYQRNIERVCRSRDEVESEIRTTVLHETGHFFGLSEEDLEEMGLG
mgnify:CR=1 FL=1